VSRVISRLLARVLSRAFSWLKDKPLSGDFLEIGGQVLRDVSTAHTLPCSFLLITEKDGLGKLSLRDMVV